MKSVNLTLPTTATANSTSFFQKAKDTITFKSFRDSMKMDFDFTLNQEDIKAIHEELGY
ncbi:MAG: hypothetical protein AB8G22_29475 [Saprospiraceae bacterium]